MVQLVGGFVDFLSIHLTDHTSQSVESVQSVAGWDFTWVLEFFTDFLGQFFNLLYNIDFLGIFDRLTFVANGEW